VVSAAQNRRSWIVRVATRLTLSPVPVAPVQAPSGATADPRRRRHQPQARPHERADLGSLSPERPRWRFWARLPASHDRVPPNGRGHHLLPLRGRCALPPTAPARLRRGPRGSPPSRSAWPASRRAPAFAACAPRARARVGCVAPRSPSCRVDTRACGPSRARPRRDRCRDAAPHSAAYALSIATSSDPSLRPNGSHRAFIPRR